MPGYLVNMSIEKAFDSVDYSFLLSVLKKTVWKETWKLIEYF